MPRSSNGPAHICYLASRIAPGVGNSAAKSLKFPCPTTCTSYFAPAYPGHGLAFVAEESRKNVSFFASPPPPSLTKLLFRILQNSRKNDQELQRSCFAVNATLVAYTDSVTSVIKME